MSATTSSTRQRLYRLEPDLRERVWGGRLLRSSEPPIGEAWLGFGGSRVGGGPARGFTVGELTAADPAWILGARLAQSYGARFPLLVKLLDCADWLSVQVHPNDEEARRMVGPDEFGKTEAWLFLSASDGARILAGVKPGTAPDALEGAVRNGTILDVAAELTVRAGDAVLVPAGMLHALGPGLLVYEVQESSDTTYRVYDWGRPATAGRALHIEESCEVLKPLAVPAPAHVDLGTPAAPGAIDVIDSEYFDVDLLTIPAASPPGTGGADSAASAGGSTARTLAADTNGDSFHLLTLVDGEATLVAGSESARLGRHETALVPAGAGAYTIEAGQRGARLLRSAVPAPARQALPGRAATD